jgi:hypothetical protein
VSAAQSRLAVERAMIELANIDDALAVTVGAIRGRVATALGQLTAVREAFDARAAEVLAELEEQARDDVATARADEERSDDAPEEWFGSWLDDEGPHAIEPLTEDEARRIYVAAFKRERGAS